MGVQRLGDDGGGRAIWDWQQEELWNSFSLASPPPLETSGLFILFAMEYVV